MCDSSSRVRHRSRPNHGSHMPRIFYRVPSANTRWHAVPNSFGCRLGRDRNLVGWRNDRKPASHCCARRHPTEAFGSRSSAADTNAIDLHGCIRCSSWHRGLCLGRSANIVRLLASASHASEMCRGLVGAQCFLWLRILRWSDCVCGGLRQTRFAPRQSDIAEVVFRTFCGAPKNCPGKLGLDRWTCPPPTPLSTFEM